MDKSAMLDLIVKWGNEYDINVIDKLNNCDWMEIDDAFAKCWYHSTTVRVTIGLNEKVKDVPEILQHSLLWHEFCHAWAYLEDGVSDDHNTHWRYLRRKKMVYVLGEYLLEFLYSPRLW